MSDDLDSAATKRDVANLELMIGRLENTINAKFVAIDAKFVAIDAKFVAIDAKFVAVDAKFNTQRWLLILAIFGTVAQIVNAWLMHTR
jgi:hypothetical protein